MRVLPFGGKIVEAEMKGRLLEQVLNTGLKNKGNGDICSGIKLPTIMPKTSGLSMGSYWM
jgi:hypothetical protein